MHPILALVIANIIWGAASPIFKYALTDIPPFTLAYLRFTIATLFFIPFLLRHWQRMNLRDYIETCIGALFGITIEIGFFFLGLQRTDSINAPIIIAAGPIFLCILSIIFLKEKPSIKVLLGTGISLIGILIIVLSPLFLSGKQLATGEIQGNIFIVIATIAAVLHPITYKKLLKRINALQVTAVGFIFSSLTFLPFMLYESHSWNISMISTPGIIGILYGAIGSSALGYYLYNYGVSKLHAQEVGIFSYIDPIAAVVIAIPLLHESISISFIIGCLCVFGGIYISEGHIPYVKIIRSYVRSKH